MHDEVSARELKESSKDHERALRRELLNIALRRILLDRKVLDPRMKGSVPLCSDPPSLSHSSSHKCVL